MSEKPSQPRLALRRMGLRPYQQVWEGMRAHIDSRGDDDDHELWLLEHPAVVTAGVRCRHQAHGDPELPAGIKLIHSDRGGLLTAHNPGQAVAYCLWRLQGLRLSVPQLVRGLEESVIAALASCEISAQTQTGQPGVYVRGEKIASVGLRIRSGWSYHGLSVNVCNDLALFENFETCGIAGLRQTSMRALGVESTVADFHRLLSQEIVHRFGFGETVALDE